MVFLSKIYTKSGDQGETGLGDGTRVVKDHPRVKAYGSVDELNAVIGLMIAQGLPAEKEKELGEILSDIQNDLFDLGADLCVPESDQDSQTRLRIKPEQVTRLENWIDHYNGALAPLKSFVLPGGSPVAAWCHLGRTVCRRAERDIVQLSHQEKLNPHILTFINRLSDFLFVLARVLNNQGQDDVLWIPGKTSQS